MNVIHGTYRQGVIVLDGPPPSSWVDGRGIDIPHEEDDFNESQEQRDAWSREWNSIPAIEMTEAEEQAWREWQQKMGDYSKDAMKRQFETLREEGA